MSFPTRHYRLLEGSLNAGQSVTVAHGLRNGRNSTNVSPNVVLFAATAGVGNGLHNASIDSWAAADATNIYLSNWDPAAGHSYSVVARSYHTVDADNQ